MTNSAFEQIAQKQIDECMNTLCRKSEEYTPEDYDRLGHFKKAAGLMDCNPREALFGMLCKHIVSLSDMCHDDKLADIDKWSEKIGDSVNYLLLLRALVVEEWAEDTANEVQNG